MRMTECFHQNVQSAPRLKCWSSRQPVISLLVSSCYYILGLALGWLDFKTVVFSSLFGRRKRRKCDPRAQSARASHVSQKYECFAV